MKFKINFKPNPGAPYFTVNDHVKSFDPKVHKNSIDYFEQSEAHLRNLFKIPSGFNFNICRLENKHLLMNLVEEEIVKDDPATGLDNAVDFQIIESRKVLLDMSYSFPQVEIDKSNFDMILIDPNASLGISTSFAVVFSKDKSLGFQDIIQDQHEKEFIRDAYLLCNVLSDYAEKGSELLLRESNYKAVVLNLMIGNNQYLKPIVDRSSRSKTMIMAECEDGLYNNIASMGFVVASHRVANKLRITIANYPTQSKEMVEMFSDRVGAFS